MLLKLRRKLSVIMEILSEQMMKVICHHGDFK